MDSEKKIDETMPEEPAEPLEDESGIPEVPEPSHGDVVIENFDDEKDEDDELYERYVELMNQEDEEDDDIAAVAERITGERHSRVSTAAPLRIRDNSAQTAPQPTSMPVRKPQKQTAPEVEVHTVHTPAGQPHNAPAKKSKRTFPAVIAAALALLILLTSVVVVVSVLNRDEPEQPPHDTLETEPVDTDKPEETDTVEPETEEIISEETEPETEEETVDEPDPVEPEPVEPEPVEPEPIPVPEYTVTLDFYDRDDITATVTQMPLADVYAAVGYTPREGDRPSVGLDYMIAADAYITIDTAEYKNVSVTETLPYGSDVIELDTIPRGEVNYINYGENGEVVRTYTVEYINGAEVSRELAWEETTKQPVNETYELGVGGSFVGADGVTYTYSYRRTVPATYYSLEGLTYLGTMADESVIAVDPEKIPLGTKVYVKNDTYDFGVRIASDVGPKVEEWEVDVWLSPSNPQYSSFAQAGYHYDMEIYYID